MTIWSGQATSSLGKPFNGVGMRGRWSRQFCLLLAFWAWLLIAPVRAAVFTVDDPGDGFDAGNTTCATPCTLRQAITVANNSAGADQIHFNIPGSGELLILPATPLPSITQAVEVDGYTQSGSTPNNDPEFSNAVLRVRLDGALLGSNGIGLAICTSTVRVRGLALTNFGGRAISAGATSAGFCGSGSTGIEIQGNFLGLGSDGQLAGGNGNGVATNSVQSLVGGTQLADRNVIAGNQTGVAVINPQASGSSVLNNLFGTDRSGLLSRVNTFGVSVAFANNVVVGSPAAPNRFRNSGIGVRINSGFGHRLFANSIFASTGAGIDLGNDGAVTPNDPDDVDGGPNNQQNFPILSAATVAAGNVNVTGTLDVGHAGDETYQIAIYASGSCDASGHGEGEILLGVSDVTLSTSNEAFSLALPTTLPLDGRTVLTATATRASDGTSEFSPCLRMDPEAPLVVNSTSDSDDGQCSAGHCSLREAILAANIAPGADRIEFAIAGAGPHRIVLGSGLPTAQGEVDIDGYSQTGASANTAATGSNAVIKIILDGSGFSSSSTAMLTVNNNTANPAIVRGLALVNVAGAGGAISLVDRVQVEGNWFFIEPDGVTAGTHAGPAIKLSGSNGVVGGQLAEQRNVLVHNSFGNGVINSSTSLSGVVIENNLIGLRPDGITPGGLLVGLFKSGGTHAGVTVRDNTIACASSFAIGAFGTVIEGNRIGTRADGASNPGCAQTRNVAASGQTWRDNVIAHMSSRAIEVGAAVNNVVISRNRLFGNAVLDIDLNANGHSANDALDVDTGGNNLQNFPLVNSARRVSDGTLELSGSLDSLANTRFRIEFFGHDRFVRFAGATALSEAQRVGDTSIDVLTDSNGHADFGPVTVNFAGSGSVLVVSATATRLDAGSNPIETSELGPAIASYADGFADLVVSNTNASGTGSFLAAVLEANARPDNGTARDRITFAIPGNGPHQIISQMPTTALLGRVEIDGYTQSGSSANTLAVGTDAVLQIELRNTSLQFDNALDALIRGLAINGSAPSGQPFLRLNGNARLEGSFIGSGTDGNTLMATLAGAATAVVECTSTGCGTIGGTEVATRNIIACTNNSNVSCILGGSAGASIIDGNLIGMRRNGTTAFNVSPTNTPTPSVSSQRGIFARVASGVGDLIRNNTIGGHIIGVRAEGNNARIEGNFIGSRLIDGTTFLLRNGGAGVWLAAGQNHRVADNRITHNGGDGIDVNPLAQSSALLGNLLNSNTGLGIDLGSNGVSGNDGLDADTGANGLQNYPVLATATRDPAGVTIGGSLNSKANTSYRLRFCYVVVADSSGFGECDAPIAETLDLTTDGDGLATFSTAAIAFVNGANQVTATAAELNAELETSSEFAQSIVIRRDSSIAFDLAPSPSVFGQSLTVSATVSVGVGGAAPTGTVAVSSSPDVGGCTINLNAGTGNCQFVPTATGVVQLTANYSGDTLTAPDSGSAPHTILPAGTTTTILTDQPDPSTPGSSFTVTFSVASAGGTPTGNVVISASGGGTCNGDLSLGRGDCLLTPTGSGEITLTADYGGSANFQVSSDTESHFVGAANTSMSIDSVSANPSVFGQAISVAATLSSAFGQPVGPIVVSDGAGASCQIAAASGSCALTPTNVGSNISLRAEFLGNGNHAGSFATVTQVVDRASVSLSVAPVFVAGSTEQPIQLAAMRVPVSVSVQSPGGGTPSGTIVVESVLGSEICVIVLPESFCDLTPLGFGLTDFTASYVGDSHFNEALTPFAVDVLPNPLFGDGFECVDDCP